MNPYNNYPYMPYVPQAQGQQIQHLPQQTEPKVVTYTVTINGTAVPILDVWGYPIRTDRLCPRKRYHGKYIVGTTAGTHVTLVNVCCTIADALANATPTVATETTGE